MFRPLWYLYKFMYKDRVQTESGEMILDTPTGMIEIPLYFGIYCVDSEVVGFLPYTPLVAPCENPKREFVHVKIKVGGSQWDWDSYEPNPEIPFSAVNHTLIISWNIYSKKILYWSANGFR